jgi:hypothetical protein
MPELSPEDVLHTELSGRIVDEVIAIVRTKGFVVLESDAAPHDDHAIACRSSELLAFGAGLGTPLVQSPRCELVEDVKDYSDVETTDDRGYRSGGELLPHSDPPTLILLHSLQQAKHGGESSLVRVEAIVACMNETNPLLVDELFQPFPDWRVAGQYGVADAGPGEPRPVLAVHNGVLSCVLYRPFIERAARETGQSLSTAQIAALDLFEQCSQSDALRIQFMLQPGQTLVLHNRSVLHARTNYVDWHEMHRRRHLLRMWIDAPTALPVHPVHELGDFFAPRTDLKG